MLHTADWKIDSNPLLGNEFDKKSFKNLGNEGLLALIGDSTKAKKELNWKAKITLHDGLLRTFNWYLNNKNFFSSISKKLYIKRIGLKV